MIVRYGSTVECDKTDKNLDFFMEKALCVNDMILSGDIVMKKGAGHVLKLNWNDCIKNGQNCNEY